MSFRSIMKHFAGSFLVAVSMIAMLLGTVMVPGYEAMHHHGYGGGGVAEMLASGLVIELIRSHYGRRRRSVEGYAHEHEERPVSWKA
ncbi:hypothetical protein CDAR_424631 [Caerostris darwini]|uniref:Uncharacterized protein n=1 Tax=Caerostris darwini TaxID=1538125 RepID=A0AAV4VAM6_9ARAC|nr:hypothetical protein CDAR_424631 [Caerostris darwini]